MFDSMLVATDGSETAAKAVSEAAEHGLTTTEPA
jgi:nucleotide-binding universal stress UspA family protein